MKSNELIKIGAKELKINQIKTFKLDAEILLSSVFKKNREEILINPPDKINVKMIELYKQLIKRRSQNEPIAYILKKKEFWSKDFEVGKGALIPRPETELMVEELVKIFKNKSIFVLDVGTGSGCILISLLSELEKSKGIGIDISNFSILLAKKNVKKHNLTSKIKIEKKKISDFYNKRFDLIVSNPPYVKSNEIKWLDNDIKNFEPLIALDGGNDGLDVIKKVIYKAKEILKINGLLALEIGNGQYKNVSKILRKNNFIIKHKIKDYGNNIRCVVSRLYY